METEELRSLLGKLPEKNQKLTDLCHFALGVIVADRGPFDPAGITVARGLVDAGSTATFVLTYAKQEFQFDDRRVLDLEDAIAQALGQLEFHAVNTTKPVREILARAIGREVQE